MYECETGDVIVVVLVLLLMQLVLVVKEKDLLFRFKVISLSLKNALPNMISLCDVGLTAICNVYSVVVDVDVELSLRNR